MNNYSLVQYDECNIISVVVVTLVVAEDLEAVVEDLEAVVDKTDVISVE
jgi:hypothetical protein